MIRLLGVINSDKVNKQNVKFTVSSLESAYRDTWNTGVPSFLNHDHEKPIAWSTIAALHFEPGMVRTANLTHVPENNVEVEIINTKIKEYYHDKVSNFISPYRDKLLNRVKTAVTENYKFNATESASIIDKDLALRIFPEIFETDDKNGLIDVSKLNPIAPGIFEHSGLLLYASPLFRRSFSRLNTLNTPFLRRFFELSTKPGLITRLALDKDMLGLPESLHEVFEFQYWWGPKFTDKLEDIPYGVTCHKSEEKHEFFTDIDRTEFWWHSQDGKQTFECEEVIQRPSLGISDSAYGCRYVHSMIDPASNEPFHLDGAIRFYTEEKILNRWDVDISNSGKDTDYNKIWRLDGSINVSEWKELISHYYRDNMLVGEYLGGIDDKKDFKPELLEADSDKVPISE
ncbi:hypothetical protein [Paenibacillus sp. tmac-D7]|uniref:hypothetical protein n=1 Tax=Paenibacillus sp. tmac-D7 TaxID=2591462 RepID=UPI0011441127|nr:hypothetical protein [Paenibacillus sp. tmac-D7]